MVERVGEVEEVEGGMARPKPGEGSSGNRDRSAFLFLFGNFIETLRAIPLVPFSSRWPPLKTKVQDFQTGELPLQETFFEVACSVIYISRWPVPVSFTFP